MQKPFKIKVTYLYRNTERALTITKIQTNRYFWSTAVLNNENTGNKTLTNRNTNTETKAKLKSKCRDFHENCNQKQKIEDKNRKKARDR
jgi:hypothetical protein